MNPKALFAAVLLTAVCLAPLAAEEAAKDSGEAAEASEDDIFGADEEVAQATEETQNAAPRDVLLQSATPWITGTFTSSVGLDWRWSDAWGGSADFLSPTSYGLSQTATSLDLGFVARPDTDISVTGRIKASYPFVQEVTALASKTATTSTTYTVPDFTVWALYSKFNWNDILFFSFGKQPLKWGTGYFFSPADDIFAQSEVDLDDPTAEREGPLALKIQYPIPGTMDNLYLFAALPVTDVSSLSELKPEDVAVAGKAEFLFGNTELAAAGYYQRSERPRALLMGTTGFWNINFFAEGLAAFPGTESEAYVEKASSTVTWGTAGSSEYSVVDRKGEILYAATVGGMYMNSDWNFTVVGQYLYNGQGYSTLTLGDLLQAVVDRTLSQPSGEPTLSYADLVSSLSGLGKIGQHYGVVYLGWTELWDTKLDFSVLALANFSDLSGYVKPTLSFTCFNYVKLSCGPSFTWGGDGSEYADSAGLFSALAAGDFDYVTKPTVSLSITASFGTTSF